MKLLTLNLVFLLLGTSVNAQRVISTEQTSEHSTYVKGNNFEGVFFSKEYQIPFSENPPVEQRFTPSIEDIELVEKLLNEQLKNINNGVNQGKSYGPKIHKKLRKYQRQYIGFISKQGERYIYLSCNWHRYNLIDRIRGFAPPRDDWETILLIVFDGGSYHWNIKINLDKEELVDLSVNGVA